MCHDDARGVHHDCGACDCRDSGRYGRHSYREVDRVTVRGDDGRIVTQYTLERCSGCGDER